MVWVVLCWVLLVIAGESVGGSNVTYDGRSLIIDGLRKILFSGSVHYPRSTPQMWPSLIAQAKEGGLDVIQTYVFWNVHEPVQGQYNFNGRYNLVKFLKLVQAQGLYASLRIGPFIESEWSYGGFPFWLHNVPGIIFRSDNEPFKFHMQNFTNKIVNLMKAQKLYASQGGPIILSQIENEYQTVEGAFHGKGPPYVEWAAAMAVGLQTGVPWMMCKQSDAPDPVINACNGLKCGETFAGPNSPNKPALWTENWTSQYQVFGEEPQLRSAKDIAFHVALFVAKKNGSFVNYYMYHGGTNFGRWASSFVTPSYYDDAPIDEYGMIRQPKWGHLKELHAAIKSCSIPLLFGMPTNYSLGQYQEAYVFQQNGGCAAFLSNNGDGSEVTVNFQGLQYVLPPKSISILPDCKNVAFNTAKVNAQYSLRSATPIQVFSDDQSWEVNVEVIPTLESTSLRSNTILDQISTTKDMSDYLWYTFSFERKTSGGQPELHIYSHGHAVHAFVNNIYAGSGHGSHGAPTFVFEKPISLIEGKNNISFLSVMVGMPDSGAYLEHKIAGLRRVRIVDGGTYQDFSIYTWGYKVGLLGESLNIYTKFGSKKVEWNSKISTHQPLTWYKTNFSTPEGNSPIALNLSTMGKGEAWVNGNSIGRYWITFLNSKGVPTQTMYHVPQGFLKPSGNLLVLFEEIGGDPLQISLNTISISRICGQVSDSHPQSFVKLANLKQNFIQPRVQLSCPNKRTISAVEFASFGTPTGGCGSYTMGSCHAAESRAVVEKACVGKRSCSVSLSAEIFGGDPCPGISKSLLIDATCT